MLRMGRPRIKNKDLFPGVVLRRGRYFMRPTNAETRKIMARLGYSTSMPLGASKEEARKKWVETFVLDKTQDGTVAQLIADYEEKKLIKLAASTQAGRKLDLKRLAEKFGARLYAKSEAQAALHPQRFLQPWELNRYLRENEDARPVAANHEIRAISAVFAWARTEGYTLFNPAKGVEWNIEEPRDKSEAPSLYPIVYAAAPRDLQLMMDLAYMCGMRVQDVLGLREAQIKDEGILVKPLKRKRGEVVKCRLFEWTSELRALIDEARVLRSEARGGLAYFGKPEERPIFVDRTGKARTETGYKSMWQRAVKRAGLNPKDLHFHDIRSIVAGDADNPTDHLGHIDPRTTRRIYQQKICVMQPLVTTPAANVEASIDEALRAWRKITAPELRRLVWSKPTSEIAQELGVSDVAIAKRCKAFGIAKPPLGFWARVAAGKIPHPNGVPPAEEGAA